MNFFQSVQRFYQSLGVCSLRLNQTYSFNLRIFLIYLVIALVFISEIAFCQFEAESVTDYGRSFFAFVIQISCCWDFTTTIWQISNILKLIEKYEKFIAKSKLPREFWFHTFSFLAIFFSISIEKDYKLIRLRTLNWMIELNACPKWCKHSWWKFPALDSLCQV